jgi:hypothetical protein
MADNPDLRDHLLALATKRGLNSMRYDLPQRHRVSMANLYEHLAGVNDLLLARATFAVAVKRWLHTKISSEYD